MNSPATLSPPASPEHNVAIMTLVAAVAATMLLGLSAATGSSHLAFQFVRRAAEYSALLLTRGPILRLELALDTWFLCAYCVMFVLIHDLLRSWNGAARSSLWLLLLTGSAICDAVENAHLLAMLAEVEQGLAVAQSQMGLQAILGHLKLTLNYAGLIALSFVLPNGSQVERALVFFLRWLQAPLGIAVLVLPLATARPFVIVRTLGFIAALGIFYWIVRQRRQT